MKAILTLIVCGIFLVVNETIRAIQGWFSDRKALSRIEQSERERAGKR